MGCIKEVSFAEFPKQGTLLGRRVRVCFHYDTTLTVGGRIIRDDIDRPFETIIALDDARVVRGVECQCAPDGSNEPMA